MLEDNNNQCNICVNTTSNLIECKNEKCDTKICKNCLIKINNNKCPYCRNEDCYELDTISIDIDINNSFSSRCFFMNLVLNIFMTISFGFFLFIIIFINYNIVKLFCFGKYNDCFLCYIELVFNTISLIITNLFYFNNRLSQKKYFFIILLIIQMNIFFINTILNCMIDFLFFLITLLILTIFNYLLYLSTI